MPTSVSKSQKTNSSLGNLYINDWKENGKVGAGTIYQVSRNLQRLDKSLTRLKK